MGNGRRLMESGHTKVVPTSRNILGAKARAIALLGTPAVFEVPEKSGTGFGPRQRLLQPAHLGPLGQVLWEEPG